MATHRMIQPDDWHIHLRDGDALKLTVKHAAKQFQRAIVMPNLATPIRTVEEATKYRARILKHIPKGHQFDPLMTLYLTDNTTVEDIEAAAAHPDIYAVKWYPAGATTNSEFGVTNITRLDDVLDCMAEKQLPLLIHGEVTDPHVDIFDREAAFIEQTLVNLLDQFRHLKVVLEHITTEQAVTFIKNTGSNVAATITAHHLLFNRNALFAGGIRPHYYCLPILKRQKHQIALLEAATSGSDKFFLGTDSAPHIITKKEASCGCAGIYTAHAAIELYASAFDSMRRLNQLEQFASIAGPTFYGLPVNKNQIELEPKRWTVPDTYPLGSENLQPLLAGETVDWRIVTS